MNPAAAAFETPSHLGPTDRRTKKGAAPSPVASAVSNAARKTLAALTSTVAANVTVRDRAALAGYPQVNQVPYGCAAPGGSRHSRWDDNESVGGSLMARTGEAPTGLRVLIAGGGVAALETMLALRELAEERVDIELLAPEPYFWYRPLAVAEPFQAGEAEHFDLATLADQVDVGLRLDALTSIDTDQRIARTTRGAELPYDALVLAIGTRSEVGIEGAFTFRGPADVEGYARILADVEAGIVRRLVFAVPEAGAWALPVYELALQTATRLAGRRDVDAELTIVTSEERPLGLFGRSASAEVVRLLTDRGIGLQCECLPVAFERGALRVVPDGSIPCDRVVAAPRLRGQPIEGVPQDSHGFVSADAFGRVRGVPDVYAAGDMTAFPIKQGGIATQQADAVASAIAARAGASVRPEPFRPVLRAILLTGGTPLHLRAEPAGSQTEDSVAADEFLWWPPAKIAGRYLAPFLAKQLLRSSA